MFDGHLQSKVVKLCRVYDVVMAEQYLVGQPSRMSYHADRKKSRGQELSRNPIFNTSGRCIFLERLVLAASEKQHIQIRSSTMPWPTALWCLHWSHSPDRWYWALFVSPGALGLQGYFPKP